MMRTTRISLLSLLLVLFGPLFAFGQNAIEPRDAPADGLELRVMTFNIRYGAADDGENHWDKRRDLVFAVFADHRPDVAGLQEALVWQIDQIRAARPRYGSIGVGRDDGKEKGEFCPILYRTDSFDVTHHGTFWLSDTPETPGSRSWGNPLPRICTWARLTEKRTGRSFYIYNLHLSHVSQPSRERSVDLLARRINDRRPQDPVIVTGDFNAGEANPAIRFLKGEPVAPTASHQPAVAPPALVDSFRVRHPDVGEAGTFNAFRGRTDGDKIDYVFVQREARVLDAAIIRDHRDGRYPSDHFPVVATVRLLGQ
ncbi:MAG TPA: endonuclease/exonuclease/phosphatase family protein [Phycisphaerae bacterium]|nr:endonuclease/exonuclease/phosphatase family protein [Phycisphaerae bacterium]